LQTTVSISLGATPPAPVTVTISSSDAAITTVTRDGTTAGGSTVTFTNVTTASVGSIVVQGRAIGATTLVVTAPGYNTGTSDVTVDPSGFFINTNDFTTTVNAANQSLDIRPARLNPTTLNWAQSQQLRGGLSVDVPITSSSTTVGTITVSPVTFHGGDISVSTGFDPAATGSTLITVGVPPGFSTPSNLRQITATVNP
jgi:hypothetical protein